MGMPALKKAAAQERRVDVGETIGKKYRELRNDFADSFAAVRKIFVKRRKKRMPERVTPLVKEDKTTIEGLIKTVEKLNREWGVYNNGRPLVELKGKTTEEKFKSLTTDVLGRSGRDATFLDPAAVDELETNVYLKMGEVHAIVPSRLAAAALGKPVVAEAPKLPVPRPLPIEKPKEVAKPKPGEAKPPGEVTKPEEVPVSKPVTGLSPGLSAYCEQVLEDLKKMADYHSKSNVQKWAKRNRPLLEKEYEKIMDKYSPQQQKRLEDVIKKLTSGELYKPGDKYNKLLAGAEKSMFESVAAAEAKGGKKHPLFETLQEVYKTVQDAKGDDRQSAKYALSDQIMHGLANLWRLDEGRRLKMAKLLVEAAIALGAGSEAQRVKWLPKVGFAMGEPGLKAAATRFVSSGEAGARERITKNNELYMAGQTALMEDLRVVREAADAVTGEINRSKLPTRNELRAAPKKHGITAYMSSKVGHNGKENLVKKFEDASKEADRMLKQESGRLSSRLVNGLYESVSANAAAVRALISLWGVANSPKVKSLLAKDKTSRGILWRNLGIATMTIIDGNFNPYRYYSSSERQMMLGMHAYLGDVELPAGKRATETKLVNMLRTSREWKYDDVIFAVYNVLTNFAPKPTSVPEQTVDTLAKLTVLQPYCERTYENYLEKDVGLKEKEKHLQSPKRLEVVRNVLIDFKDILGLKKGDPLYGASEKWLTHAAGKLDAKDIPAVSDTLHQMLVNLISIRKAEVWLANKGLQPSSLSEETRKEAKEAIEKAKEVYAWQFSGGPERPPTIYQLLPASLAQNALELLAPPATDVTGGQGRFAFLTPLQDPTVKEKDKVPKAAEIEKSHLNLVISQKDNVSFSGSAVDDLLEREGYLSAYRMLDPIVGRVSPIRDIWKSGREGRVANVKEVKARRLLTKARMDTHLDQNGDPHETRGHYPAGQVYVEVRRQDMIHHDKNAPAILTKLEVGNFIAGMEAIAEGWGARPPKKQLEGSNTVLLKLLEARLDEINARLEGKRKDGAVIKFLSDAKHPKAEYVKIAKKELERLKKDLAALPADKDLFTNRGVNVRHRIAIAEMLLASLSDENIKDIPKVEKPLEAIKVAVSEPETEFEGGQQWGKFRASFYTESGKRLMTSEIESIHWAFYTDKGNRQVILLNPKFDPVYNSGVDEGVARLMKLATTDKSGRPEYGFVKARPPGKATGAEPLMTQEWVPLRDKEGKSELLFRVTVRYGPAGELLVEPLKEDLTPEKLNLYFARTLPDVNYAYCPVTGKTHAMVVVRRKPRVEK
jgi:hypothetical protein